MAVNDLDAIFEAWDKRAAAGSRSSSPDVDVLKIASGDAKVYQLADAYVAKHEADFRGLEGKSGKQLVEAIDVFRAAGYEDEVKKIQVWLWHAFEPQNIGGEAQFRLRVPSG